MKGTIRLLGAAALILGGQALAGDLKRAYLDDEHNVHVVTEAGKDLRLTVDRRAAKVTLSPDNKAAAWVLQNEWTSEEDTEPGSSRLVVYRNGKAGTINCEPFIRDYWFWMNGRRIAIDCGGRHFAGREQLYDTATMKMVAGFQQDSVPLEKRPSWSKNDDE